MPKRAASKQFLPGLYELPGGHIDFGEDIVAGLKREIKEELRMTLIVGDPFAVFTYQNLIKGSHSVEVIYFAQFVEPIDHMSVQPEDHSEYRWFTYDEVIKNKSAIIPTEHVIEHEDGPEYQAILRGFELLSGKPLRPS